MFLLFGFEIKPDGAAFPQEAVGACPWDGVDEAGCSADTVGAR